MKPDPIGSGDPGPWGFSSREPSEVEKGPRSSSAGADHKGQSSFDAVARL
jgi:hypothetical protein